MNIREGKLFRFGMTRISVEQAACVLSMNETPMASQVLANEGDYYRAGFKGPEVEFCVIDELPTLRESVGSSSIPGHRFIVRPSKTVPSGFVAVGEVFEPPTVTPVGNMHDLLRKV